MVKLTVKAIVTLSLKELKEMKTHKQLRDWAVAKGFDNKTDFWKFKQSLLDVGIDYEKIRNGN